MNFLPLAIWATFFPVCGDISVYLNFKMGKEFKDETMKVWAGFYLFGIIVFTVLGLITNS